MSEHEITVLDVLNVPARAPFKRAIALPDNT